MYIDACACAHTQHAFAHTRRLVVRVRKLERHCLCDDSGHNVAGSQRRRRGVLDMGTCDARECRCGWSTPHRTAPRRPVAGRTFDVAPSSMRVAVLAALAAAPAYARANLAAVCLCRQQHHLCDAALSPKTERLRSNAVDARPKITKHLCERANNACERVRRRRADEAVSCNVKNIYIITRE